jgi:protein ImuB
MTAPSLTTPVLQQTDTLSPSARRVSRRFLAIALPHLATDRIERRRRLDGDDGADGVDEANNGWGPRATVVRAASTLRLAAVNPAAARRGLTVGLALADARARHPDLSLTDADPEGEQRTLETLADWCCRWTPYIGLDVPDGLMLDITGCAYLFGGETALRTTVQDRLTAHGFIVRTAVASTPACAWAVARFSGGGHVATAGAHAALRPLPLAALKLPAETVDALLRVGLKRIGEIVDLPRAPLTARFGPHLLERLDQAFGLAGEAISPRMPVTPCTAERRFFEPISLQSDILATIEDLGDTLTNALEERGAGARQIVCTLFRVDGHVACLTVGTGRPIRRGAAMRALMAERMHSLASAFDAGFGFDLIRLSVPVSAPFGDEQMGLGPTGLQGDADRDGVAHLIDRLGARFGQDRVVRFAHVDTHIPERAVRTIPAHSSPFSAVGLRAPSPLVRTKAPETAAPETAAPDRPIRLFAKPEPIEVMAAIPHGPPMRFRWRRVLRTITHAEGPERIAPEWWRPITRHEGGQPDEASSPSTRDYFRVEDTAGQRYWLFRAGLYERRGDTPRWFIHGVFA